MRSADPTGTGLIRHAFRTAAQKRVVALRHLIQAAVVEQDLLGLTNRVSPAFVAGQFATMSGAEKLQAFNSWLSRVSTNALIGDGIWMKHYVQQAYNDGQRQALADLNLPRLLSKPKH